MSSKLTEMIENRHSHDNREMVTEEKEAIIKHGLQLMAYTLGVTFVSAAAFMAMGWTLTGLSMIALIGVFFAYLFIGGAIMTSIMVNKDNKTRYMIGFTLFGIINGLLFSLTLSTMTVVSFLVVGVLSMAVTLSCIMISKKYLIDASGWEKPILFSSIACIVGLIATAAITSTLLTVVVSIAIIAVMSAYIMYETQEAIKNPASSGPELAIGYFLSFLNIFLSIANLLGID